MKDYKTTLNLPHTEFQMRANLPEKEPQILAKWQQDNLYQKIALQNQGKQKFILHFGPPYANGDIHIGHAVTTILKDMVVKSKLLSGYDTPLVPGWDCHGLPIEINVEKNIKEATPSVFRQACRDYAHDQIERQKTAFVRLGILADWQHPYKTMDFSYEADIIRAVGCMLAQNHLQPGVKPVHWCMNCGSALAEAEVEYQDKTSMAMDVLFKVVDVEAFLQLIDTKIEGDINFVIWTTTPWTLVANQAVALHPQGDYVLVKTHLPQIICMVESLLESALKRYNIAEYQIVARFKGQQVEKQRLFHPFYDKKVPLVLSNHVTMDTGTGAVHIAPGHGQEDYVVGCYYQLAIEAPVTPRGCFTDIPYVAGLSVLKSNDKIAELLKERHNLLHSATITHSYPHCWRHKTPLIFRATKQWFVSMDNQQLRQQVLQAINKVQWIPQWGESRIRLMIEGRPDWCISRQRLWGVPLTLFLHKQTGALHPQMVEMIELIAQQVEAKGIEAWYQLDVSTLPYDLSNYEPVKDVLDVWFDSGVSHSAVVKKRPALQFPADLYLEGSDQHRGWFQSALLTSVAMYQEAPYRAVLTHGFAVDAQGRKMSKSLGNVVSPEKVIKTLGADVLRLWIAATDYKGEMHVSDEILSRMKDAYRRIRNTVRFLLANLHGFDPHHLVKPSELVALDAWIIDYAARLQEEIRQAYDHYQFHLIYQKIHNFCVVELGSFYLDIIKDRQYTIQSNGQARRSAQSAMYFLAHALTRWLAPILSFTAEEIWQYLPGEKTESVFMSQWLNDLPRLPTSAPMNDAFWQTLIQVRNQVNKALEKERVQGHIGGSLDASVFLYTDELYSVLSLLQDELRFVLITSYAKVAPLAEKKEAESTELADLWIKVIPSAYEKCVRCWHRREDVNQHPNYEQICGRCVTNIGKSAEERYYA